MAAEYVMMKKRRSRSMTPASTCISSVRRPWRTKTMMAAPITNIASVLSMNGAPTMAPMPMSVPATLPLRQAPTMAMIGMMVSGRAVPTAASTEPTAPSERFSFLPTHSIELTKASQARMMPAIDSRAKTMVNKRSMDFLNKKNGSKTFTRAMRAKVLLPCRVDRAADREPIGSGNGDPAVGLNPEATPLQLLSA
ncbi:hypothetical protein D3C87_1450820 [compost metagenome]